MPLYIFTTNVAIFTREFKGQSSGPQIEKTVIRSNDKSQFCDSLWEKIKPLIKAEIVVAGDKFEWSTNELSKESLDK